MHLTQLSLFVIPMMFLIAVIYNGAAHSFSPQNGAVFCCLPLMTDQARGTSSVQVDLQPLVRLSNPLSAAERSVALQNHRWVMGKRHPGADTCAVEVCKVPDTLGGCDLFFFQLLTQPDRISLRVFCFGSANIIPSHCEISGSVPAHPHLLSL